MYNNNNFCTFYLFQYKSTVSCKSNDMFKFSFSKSYYIVTKLKYKTCIRNKVPHEMTFIHLNCKTMLLMMV